MERLFCVVPVVANIRLEVLGQRCVFSWKERRSFRPSAISPDLLLEEADEGLLQELQDAHASAAFEGFVLHEEQPNHREVWAYRDYLPMELAKLPATAEAFAPRRTRKERANTMARELSSQDDRRLRMLCLTWNVGATLPQRGASLEAVLDEDPSPDICVIGFQETCQLSARRLLADGTEWKDWQKWADQSVKDARGPRGTGPREQKFTVSRWSSTSATAPVGTSDKLRSTTRDFEDFTFSSLQLVGG
ncbi:unnamed protein product [Durusdinium trenchii]|uniref:Inositol polyphosphate-related phosphatase domain-containing protein n=1 Tax=Durusdinium trenchii TaxID=1381693 RepID=A0ABP0N6R3_9DINO